VRDCPLSGFSGSVLLGVDVLSPTLKTPPVSSTLAYTLIFPFPALWYLFCLQAFATSRKERPRHRSDWSLSVGKFHATSRGFLVWLPTFVCRSISTSFPRIYSFVLSLAPGSHLLEQQSTRARAPYHRSFYPVTLIGRLPLPH